GMLSFTKAPITMDVTEKKVKFSGPESSVEMDVMTGFGGKPVKISNLPNPAYQDYTQYKSISHTHSSDKAKWSHSGTNGFTSTMDVGSAGSHPWRPASAGFEQPRRICVLSGCFSLESVPRCLAGPGASV